MRPLPHCGPVAARGPGDDDDDTPIGDPPDDDDSDDVEDEDWDDDDEEPLQVRPAASLQVRTPGP